MNSTKKYLALTAAALLSLAGCGKELAPMGAEMTVEATLGALTKVSADGSAFTIGDQIAVYAWLGSATKNPTTRVVDGVVNTFDGSKWTPATMMRWQVTDDPHYFLGVYPAPKAAIADLTAVPFALDPADYAAGDLLLATTPAGVKNTGAAVPLGFHHVMARLDVNLRFRNEWPSVPAASNVSVCVEAKSGATVNYLTQTVTPSGAAGDIALVPATAATGYSLGFSSLQVPQDGVRKIIVEVDGFEYVFASANDIPLTSGKYTTLNLVLGKDKLELASVSVSDWTATTLSGVEADPTWALATPLTVEAKEAGAGVRFDIFTEEATNPVYFRTHDGVAWSDWAEYGSGTTVTLAKVGDKVQFKGNNARYAYSASGSSTFAFSKDCYVYGNIMSLITSTDFSICTTFTKGYALQKLFYWNTHIQLHPTQELLLPATTLSDYCYKEMFARSSVTSSPKLPAMTLMTGCYDAMFWLSALKVAPELPATTLIEKCYREMFYGCANLTTAPTVLPATKLKVDCYDEMFSGCTSLETAPTISATTMAVYSCHSMFSGCTSLKNVPDLPATTMAPRCCMEMFSGCTSLTTAPKLAATTLADLCCYRMFKDCTSLTTIPDNMLPATTLEIGCYSGMFLGCSKLATVPNTMLPATTLAAHCYTQMFQECTSLTATPALPATELASACYDEMFASCHSLTTVLVLPSTTMEASCYDQMFLDCQSLTAIPTGMLPATNLADNCYGSMFNGCGSLNSVPNDLLPATSLEHDCYNSMFAGCISMTTGPILPAETLVDDCYYEMFLGCDNLSSVICLANPSTISVGDKPIKDWLKLVAETGTFYAKYSWSGYEDYIPSGWTVASYNP